MSTETVPQSNKGNGFKDSKLPRNNVTAKQSKGQSALSHPRQPESNYTFCNTKYGCTDTWMKPVSLYSYTVVVGLVMCNRCNYKITYDHRGWHEYINLKLYALTKLNELWPPREPAQEWLGNTTLYPGEVLCCDSPNPISRRLRLRTLI